MDSESKLYFHKSRLTLFTVLAVLFWLNALMGPDRLWYWVWVGFYTAVVAALWVFKLRVDNRRKRELP